MDTQSLTGQPPGLRTEPADTGLAVHRRTLGRVLAIGAVGVAQLTSFVDKAVA